MSTACLGRIRKDMCERKAYPHKVCPPIGIVSGYGVNKIGSLSRYV